MLNVAARVQGKNFLTGQGLGSNQPAVDAQVWAATPRDLEPRSKTMSKFIKLIKNTKGATAIEYGLIAALIAVAAIGAMQGIGNKLNTTFNNVSNSLN
jgi:pilus assembly protein Flp/PilA